MIINFTFKNEKANISIKKQNIQHTVMTENIISSFTVNKITLISSKNNVINVIIVMKIE